MKKVSVLMSIKNGEHFLPNSIKDIEINVSRGDEVLVIDDGSDDQTSSILNLWAKRNKQVRILKNPGKGLVDSLNLGVKESSNNWLVRFDVDDKYLPDRILKQRELISDSIALIFCDYEFFTNNENSLGVVPSAIDNSSTVISLVSSQRTPHPGALISKESLLAVGGYRKEDFPAEDISLWLRLAKIGKLQTVPKVLLNYRISSNSVSALNRTQAQGRTKELFGEIGLNRDAVLDGLVNWESIFRSYDNVTLSHERKILFYRDLKNSLNYLDLEIKFDRELNQIRRQIFLDFSNLRPLVHLVSDKFRRHLYRRF